MLNVAFFMLGLTATSLVSQQVPLLREAGWTPAETTQLQTLFGFGLLFARVAVGFVIDHIFAPRVMMAVSIGGAIACILYAVYPDAAYVSALLIGFLLGAEFDVLAFLIKRYYGNVAYGRIYGVIFGVFYLGSGLGITGLAWIRQASADQNYDNGLYVAAVVLVGSAILMAFAPQYRYKPGAEYAGNRNRIRSRTTARLATSETLKMMPISGKTTALAAMLGRCVCATANAQDSALRPVTDAMLENPDPADWLMWRRTQNHWAYSPLEQVDRRNVAQLRLVWTRPLAQGVQEGTPLVHDGVMFFPSPNDITQALDAATGDLIWEYKRPVQSDNSDYIPFPSINRNLAIYGNFILDNGADNYAYALDARTGALAWETQILDYRRGAQHSSGPIVADGKVISGRSCEPEGGPEACVITAFDATTGKEVWRTRTIPRPDEPGGDSWGDIPYEERRHVGLWMVPSYDPELRQIYVGTSVTSPAPKFMLAGNDKEYLYHNSTLALNVDTGKVVWYLQHNVDHWDLDHPFERHADRYRDDAGPFRRAVDQSARASR